MLKSRELEKIEKMLNNNKIRAILAFWRDKPEQWVRSCELREALVKSYQNKQVIYRENGRYYDSKNMKIKKHRPKPIYNYDSELYRDLTRMKKFGILKHKEKPKSSGKPESYYRPCNKFKNEGLRIENKVAMDFFPPDKIMNLLKIPGDPEKISYTKVKHILYGLSEELYRQLNENDRQTIRTCLEEIEERISKIEGIKMKVITNEIGKKLDVFLKKTKSGKIKKMLKHRPGWLLGVVDNVIMANEKYISILSKKVFKLSLESLSKYSPGKEFGFSPDDLKELAEWAWQHKNFFSEIHPISVAFSRYSEREENFLTQPMDY